MTALSFGETMTPTPGFPWRLGSCAAFAPRRWAEGRRELPVAYGWHLPARNVPKRPLAAMVLATMGPVARPELMEERALCERAKAGDRGALGQILRTYGPQLYRSVLLPRLGSDAIAQDALADTYARVIERFHQFEWQQYGVYPWLRVVALRIALDGLRARKRETLYEPDDLEREIDAADRGDADCEAELAEKRDLADARARVDRALSSINPRYATAIRLRVLEERPREEVAEALGVTVATFDVVLHRALTALKKNLAKSAEEAEPRSVS